MLPMKKNSVHGKPGQEARVTSVYLMPDWARKVAPLRGVVP